MERRTESEEFKGCWTVIRCAGGYYVGRAVCCLIPNEFDGKWAVLDESTGEDPITRLLRASVVTLDPAYEFICQAQIQPTEQGMALTGKFFFATSIGAAVLDGAAYLNLTGAFIQPFSKMNEYDVETYKDSIRNARRLMDEARKRMAAARSGILLTSNMPKDRRGS